MPFSQTAGTVTGTETVVLGVLVAVSSTTSVAVPSVCTMVIEYVQEVTNRIVKTIRARRKMLVYANLKLSIFSLCLMLIPFFCFSDRPRVFLTKMFAEKMICSYNLVNEFPEDSVISKRSYWQGRMDSYNHCLYIFFYCDFDPMNCQYNPPTKYLDDPCDYGIKP